ncbi:hypothetical protein BCR42DRAFT_427161 [Absidia repens]|uniref:Uncharacterized protein n=1 Tax=Absidia repens TaxID=90262 RepID=A0A1X2I031_9FUNG|nr:hypothetical protein BCR42DRAFT_427161 [Absidia repens]
MTDDDVRCNDNDDADDDDDDGKNLLLDRGVLDSDKVSCLFSENPYVRWMKIKRRNKLWAHKLVGRKHIVRQTMKLLEDLILDWSTRVWVISEYHLAKDENKLKYWFLQLSSWENRGWSFFKFDFVNPAFFSVVQNTAFRDANLYNNDPNPADLLFHRLIIQQLTTQTFFEMILKSKASKNEDRFYAILPQSKYKDKVNQVDRWVINNMISVKLKLFEIMDTKDKWTLLFFSGCFFASNTYEVLPSFCASNLPWHEMMRFFQDDPHNFDMANASSAITLHCTNHLRRYYLRLTPKEYYVVKEYHHYNVTMSLYTLYKHLQVDKDSVIDIVWVPQYDTIAKVFNTRDDYVQSMVFNTGDDYLKYASIKMIGSFAENKWTLCDHRNITDDISEYVHHFNDDHRTVFNIY